MGLSEIPIELSKVPKELLDMEIARAGMIAELDAINLYEQMAAMTDNQLLKKVLFDIAREEKTHLGEFETMLLIQDPQQVSESEGGRQEVEEMKEKKTA